jgi:PQQ-dependent dehydrogenase (methanol/ethanol family)
MAAQTWNGEWWAIGGGGTVWDAIVYDEVNDSLLLGVGNGSPWNASVRSPGGGDNLFLSSIVAVDPDTGEYKWHFQQIPWETWDYTATQPIMLADIEVDGRERRVIMQAPKNGFFYVIDAATGEFISGTNFVPVTWASGLDPVTGAPIVNPEARYDVTGQATIVVPSSQGAHSWNPWSYSPETGLVYLPAMMNSLPYKPDPNFRTGAFNIAVDWISGDYLYDEPGNTIPRGTRGFLTAWDPVTQREVWRTEPTPGGSAGTLATAGGLVFQGRGQELFAYNAADGTQLWSAGTQAGTAAAPISYELDGEQYVALVVGGAQPGGYYAPSLSRLLVYKLGAAETLPEPAAYEQPPISDAEQFATAPVVAEGGELYAGQCGICHGANGITRGMFPDLLRSPALQDQQLFDTIVLDGVLAANGMRSFEAVLEAPDSEAIRAYLIDRAAAARTAQPPG